MLKTRKGAFIEFHISLCTKSMFPSHYPQFCGNRTISLIVKRKDLPQLMSNPAKSSYFYGHIDYSYCVCFSPTLSVFQTAVLQGAAYEYSLTLRVLMSYIYIYIYIYIYGAPILDVSRLHTTTHHSR